MKVCIYGEIANDILVDTDSNISRRWGGAGLYAALSAARQGTDVELLTVTGSDLDPCSRGLWEEMGVSFNYSELRKEYQHPSYLVTGFKAFGMKKSRPLQTEKIFNPYLPSLPDECDALIIFPIGHFLPKSLCEEAREKGILVFLDPKPNELSIISAKELLGLIDVLLVNEEEANLLSGKDCIEDSLNYLLTTGPQYVVIKRGILGSVIGSNIGEINHVPSFRSMPVCTLGSGDVFAGALVPNYIESEDILKAIKVASCVAANFIETNQTEAIISKRGIEEDLLSRDINDFVPKGKEIYLAGPFFSAQELNWVNKICSELESAGIKVLSPSRENGIISEDISSLWKREIFQADIQLLEKADLVVAVLDHQDTGTSFEIGYAFKKGIPVIGLKTSIHPVNNMIRFGCSTICTSIDQVIKEVYKVE